MFADKFLNLMTDNLSTTVCVRLIWGEVLLPDIENLSPIPDMTNGRKLN